MKNLEQTIRTFENTINRSDVPLLTLLAMQMAIARTLASLTLDEPVTRSEGLTLRETEVAMRTANALVDKFTAVIKRIE